MFAWWEVAKETQCIAVQGHENRESAREMPLWYGRMWRTRVRLQSSWAWRFGWLREARRKTTTASQEKPNDALADSPCKHLSPMPAEIQQQMAAMEAARKSGKPMPPLAPADMAAFRTWQEQGLREDFGGNCRYESANASLPPATDHRIVFIGDSITEGWGRMDPTLFSGDVINRGISGQTTAQMLVRFRQDVVDLHPHAVHILAGVNDLAGNTGPSSVARVESNIMSMVDMAKANHIEVVLASELPATVIPWRRGNQRQRADRRFECLDEGLRGKAWDHVHRLLLETCRRRWGLRPEVVDGWSSSQPCGFQDYGADGSRRLASWEMIHAI